MGRGENCLSHGHTLPHKAETSTSAQGLCQEEQNTAAKPGDCGILGYPGTGRFFPSTLGVQRHSGNWHAPARQPHAPLLLPLPSPSGVRQHPAVRGPSYCRSGIASSTKRAAPAASGRAQDPVLS